MACQVLILHRKMVLGYQTMKTNFKFRIRQRLLKIPRGIYVQRRVPSSRIGRVRVKETENARPRELGHARALAGLALSWDAWQV